MAALPGQQFDIELSGVSIRYRQYTAGGTAQWNYYPVINIKCVESVQQIGFGTRDAVTNQRKNSTRQDDLLRITISFVNDTKPLVFDIQNVMNQAGWTPDDAGVTQALSDINTWIGSGMSSGGGSASTDALLQEIVDQNTGQIVTGAADVVWTAGAYSLPGGQYFSADVIVLSGTVYINNSTIALGPGSYPYGGDPNQVIANLDLEEVTPAVVTIRLQSKIP